ncbi:MAG: 5'/3'-nucleotidase SurE [Pseudomonadota bacterium]
MRILVSNDDGVHAPGLAVLERVAAELSDDVWVVAPENEQSGAARALSLSTPLRVREAGHQKFAVYGTPTDCVVMGMETLVEGKRPDLVLSGVNRGQNIAEDVTLSGTIAAAFQGMSLGVPSIALSQSRRGGQTVHWETAERFAPRIIRNLVGSGWPPDVVMNVNFPAVPPEEVVAISAVSQGRREHLSIVPEQRTDLRGNPYYWFGFKGRRTAAAEGTDVHAMDNAAIAVTPLHLSLTHADALASLQSRLTTLTIA